MPATARCGHTLPSAASPNSETHLLPPDRDHGTLVQHVGPAHGRPSRDTNWACVLQGRAPDSSTDKGKFSSGPHFHLGTLGPHVASRDRAFPACEIGMNRTWVEGRAQMEGVRGLGTRYRG